MVAYTYSKLPTANFNTTPPSIARSATGSVYDVGDTGFTTPLNMTMVVGGAVVTTISSNALGFLPDFTLDGRVSCVWKQTGATFATVLTTSDPIPGPPGPNTIPTDTAIKNAVTDPASLTAGALNATYVPKWKAATAYLAGDKVLSPNGDVVSSIADHTSGSNFTPANWNLSSTYAPATGSLNYAAKSDLLGRTSVVNVMTDYGAKGDGKQSLNGGSITTGTTALTVTSAGFTSADVGKAITVRGAGVSGANLTTTIAAFVNSTNVTLTAAASATVSAAAVSWGTDDTVAFQNALNFAGPKALQVFVPKPNSHYVLTGPLTVNNWYGLCVRGDNWETTEIRHYADNTPMFRWPLDNVHSQTFERMRLTYANPQNNTVGPNSVVFARDNVDGTSSLSGHYHHAFRDLKIIGATYGFKVLRSFAGDTTSTNPWWGCEWTRILFTSINRSCISLNLGTVGAPCNRFDQIKVFQTQAFPNDGIEAAFILRGEAVMTAIDVEQWHNQVINMPSGNYLNINGLHIEHHYVDNNTGGNRAIYIANVAMNLSSFFIGYDSTDSFSKYAIYADTNAHAVVRGAQLQTPNSGASYLFTTNATPGSSKIAASGVNVTGFGSGTSLWVNGSTTISDVYEIDGQAPVLLSSDALPTAAAAYRGRRYTQLGNGTTTADQTVQCLMSATGTYSWKTLVSG